MPKRIISLFLAVLTVLSLCAPALAAEPADEPAAAASGSCGANVTWSLSGSTLTISGTGPMKNYTSTHSPWYSYSSSIKKLNIQNGVTAIGDYAFEGLFISSVTIPDSVVSLGKAAFVACGLTSITIPGSVRSIGNGAFAQCTELTKAVLSKGVVSIGETSFSQTALTSVTIPASVTSIGYGAFNFDHDLTSITVDSGNRYYASQNGVLFNKAKTTLIKYPAKKSGRYTIPSTVTSIADDAFRGCEHLTGLTIPDSVTSIGGRAFDSCGLPAITIPRSVTVLGEYVFDWCGQMDITILNPSCVIKSLGYYIDVTIHGYDGSTAQAYARKNGIKFVSLGAAPAAKKGWVTEGGKKYYYQNGAKLKGLYLIGGQRYYFSAKDGAMLTGIVTVDNDGHKCYFSAKDGHRITGLVTVDSAGHKCYFSAKTGYQLKGLVTTDAKGTQRYFSAKTGYMLKNGWYNIGGGKKALINASGVVTRITRI